MRHCILLTFYLQAERATTTAMSRKDFDFNNMSLLIKDVMGEAPLNNPKLKTIIEEINSKIGWTAIKNSVTELVNTCDSNYNLELEGKILGSMNSAFTTLETLRCRHYVGDIK